MIQCQNHLRVGLAGAITCASPLCLATKGPILQTILGPTGVTESPHDAAGTTRHLGLGQGWRTGLFDMGSRLRKRDPSRPAVKALSQLLQMG
jgi:hypothetical protein